MLKSITNNLIRKTTSRTTYWGSLVKSSRRQFAGRVFANVFNKRLKEIPLLQKLTPMIEQNNNINNSGVQAGTPCEGDGCGSGAKFFCPTCMKLRLPKSFFCSQDCFKRNWASHKNKHAAAQQPAAGNPWPQFSYTGTLRPVYPLSPRREVPSHIARPDYAEDGIPRSELAMRGNTTVVVLNEEEREKMRVVCRIGREVLDAAARRIAVGVTTDDIDRVVHEETIKRNAYPSPLNYQNFPKSCCTSVNEVICHGIPDGYKLQDGDLLNIDVSVFFDGFHADLNETYFVGENVPESSRRLVNETREALKLAIEQVRPGALYRDLGNTIEAYCRKLQPQPLSVVRSYCGHGVGRLFHTTPSIPHYAKSKAIGVMKPGHVFTIEPMINEGTYRDEQWPDRWTVVTQDGRRSAQFEHTILVTETGYEVLTRGLEHDTVLNGLK